MASMGSARMRATCRASRNLAKLKSYLLMNWASSRAVAILENSAGWSRKGPSANQDFEPLTSTPTKATATSSRTISA